MPAAHATLGPSSASRWLRCPGSVKMSDGVAEDRSSVFAAEGTVAHHVRECVLMFGFELEEFVGMDITADGFTFTVDDEMIEHLRPGIEWIEDRPGRLVNEYRVTFDRWLPGQFGTLDVGLVAPDLITINDLKYGAGVPVSPERNEQLMTYALGFWDNVAQHETHADQFLLVIDQPRAIGGGGEWRVGLEELLEFGERLKRGYATIYDLSEPIPDYKEGSPPFLEDAILAAGEKQCRFCKAKDFCPEYARFCLDQMDAILDDLDGDELTLADADLFSSERRATVAENADLIKKWVDAVHARVLSDAIRGFPTPGLKAVKGRRGKKTWLKPAKAKKFLLKNADKSKIMSAPQIISPTQAEGVIPKSRLAAMKSLWSQAEGKPVLVHEDDPKPAINHSAVLDDLDDEDELAALLD
ncbi:DUF2800 domain-containing protein [Shimia sp.]|uniref:DUF2800 domain-containing protein n=1 Tax=Shimia sp. TaxID=1954381 RepID=UPI003298E99F